MKYLIHLILAVLAVLNLGFSIHGVTKIFDGDHSIERCFIVALDLVIGIYCLISELNLRKELEVID